MKNILTCLLPPPSKPVLLVFAAGGALIASPAMQAQLPPLPTLGSVVRDELIKFGVKLIIENTIVKNGQSFRNLVAGLGGNQPSLRLTVEITEYQKTSRLKYPHQPLMKQDYSIKLITAGYLITRKRSADGAPLPQDSLLVPLTPGGVGAIGESKMLPDWWIPPQLNHLTRNCGIMFNGEFLYDDSDETFQLVVRSEGSNWKASLGSQVNASVLVRLDKLTDTCRSAFELMPNGEFNGRLTSAIFSPINILIDGKGNGASAPIRMADPKRFIEVAGNAPSIVNPVLVQISQSPLAR